MHICYPEGKSKALIFSYDDGRTADRRLVELFNRHGLKGTFHLNSGKLGQPGYVSQREVPALYAGHEISCHGVDHENLVLLSQGQRVAELWWDRHALEQYSGRPVTGLSYPYGTYDAQVVEECRSLGFEYSRTTKPTMGYWPPDEFLRWDPTCHHKAAFAQPELIRQFLDPDMGRKSPLLFIWGHSYELEAPGEWEKMERLCGELSGHDAVWYTTCLDYCRYFRAARSLVFSADRTSVYSPSHQTVWLRDDSHVEAIPGGLTTLDANNT